VNQPSRRPIIVSEPLKGKTTKGRVNQTRE
jgi:hypothetical protein